MARRGDPAKIEAAKREGTRQRLISTGLLTRRVDELLDAFDALPERHGQSWDSEAAFESGLAQPRQR